MFFALFSLHFLPLWIFLPRHCFFSPAHHYLPPSSFYFLSLCLSLLVSFFSPILSSLSLLSIIHSSCLITSDSLWVGAKHSSVSSLEASVCFYFLLPPLCFFFSFFSLLLLSPQFIEQPSHMVIYNSTAACLQNKQIYWQTFAYVQGEVVYAFAPLCVCICVWYLLCIYVSQFQTS